MLTHTYERYNPTWLVILQLKFSTCRAEQRCSVLEQTGDIKPVETQPVWGDVLWRHIFCTPLWERQHALKHFLWSRQSLDRSLRLDVPCGITTGGSNWCWFALNSLDKITHTQNKTNLCNKLPQQRAFVYISERKSQNIKFSSNAIWDYSAHHRLALELGSILEYSSLWLRQLVPLRFVYPNLDSSSMLKPIEPRGKETDQ